MRPSQTYSLQTGWRVVLRDLGIESANVLRRAGLPEDLLNRESASLSVAQYFDFWRGLEAEAHDPLLPIRICESISAEAFDAPLFAALCSPDLNTAMQRLSHHKRLICPMRLHVEVGPGNTSLELEWLDEGSPPPVVLVATELVFFVRLARLATRERVQPLAVTTPMPPQPREAYASFFGLPVETGTRHGVVFSAADGARPFLTANVKMWEFFEPQLRRRLSELDAAATTRDRVRGALLELLPAGNGSLQAVARKLAMSPRTLQRRLGVEGQRFQHVLDSTREELARHYLVSSTLSGAEISFLLGYEDPNSFFRAFQGWTGATPGQVRAGQLTH